MESGENAVFYYNAWLSQDDPPFTTIVELLSIAPVWACARRHSPRTTQFRRRPRIRTTGRRHGKMQRTAARTASAVSRTDEGSPIAAKPAGVTAGGHAQGMGCVGSTSPLACRRRQVARAGPGTPGRPPSAGPASARP